MWFMELWNKGKRVMTLMLGMGHEGGQDDGLKRATHEPFGSKHGSKRLLLRSVFHLAHLGT
jgi:hypothetical protein